MYRVVAARPANVAVIVFVPPIVVLPAGVIASVVLPASVAGTDQSNSVPEAVPPLFPLTTVQVQEIQSIVEKYELKG